MSSIVLEIREQVGAACTEGQQGLQVATAGLNSAKNTNSALKRAAAHSSRPEVPQADSKLQQAGQKILTAGSKAEAALNRVQQWADAL